MVKQQCLFGTLLFIKVPGRHFLVLEFWRKGVKMAEPNRQSGENEERIIEIEIERLRSFKEHPFQVKDDKEMFLLQESIEKYGILNPLIVRPVPDGYYEIISGHRRKHAAEKLGYRKVPVIIRVLSEDDSILSMVDSNLHRERISYSEKAFAYKLKNDVLKRKSGRKKSQVDHKTPRKRAIEIISEDCGDSPKQVQRYISLTKLIPEMLQKLDDAIVAMVDANIQREELLQSEKVFAYKMKLEAMKRQGSRTDITSGQNDQKLKPVISRNILADQVGESSKQIQRYIRLTELIPELFDLVDNKKLQFTVTVDISYIDKEVQEWIYEYISDTGFIKPKQIAALRNQLNDGPINQIQMLSIFNNCVMAKKVSRSLTFSEKKLTKYFPDDYTAKDMEQVIESLLEKWMQEQSC
jgi:ParB/RepB/Spo0J family partition protein